MRDIWRRDFGPVDLNLLRVRDAMTLELSTVPCRERVGLSQPAVSSVHITVPHFQAVSLVMSTDDLLGSIPIHFARLVADHLYLDVFMPPMESPTMDVTIYWHRRLDRDAGNVGCARSSWRSLRSNRGSMAILASSNRPGVRHQGIAPCG
ncbi:hypothetical protein [Mesorhizobium sp. M2A.F.Ca.ET.067.02.1.1]|uniref:hypothetical protein n=1 Tax=Mesorhizobium sp. M2A.F.Ca.ET.067.02.1.1 TaxID=2496749 RepID=UPI000FD608B9|nr:hypothetical protein [Mesorhizobium sp. M2A.F.Ca.ET.067.02.1.1]RUW80180.1 hypothetical protein EOA28_05795 [Mesorhizobium sp. M2A.F.Ca.ET.067.02.1.1]TIU58587.1 MAG: hypothetical protein E5W35_03640 [Mesorhizobium sp.]